MGLTRQLVTCGNKGEPQTGASCPEAHKTDPGLEWGSEATFGHSQFPGLPGSLVLAPGDWTVCQSTAVSSSLLNLLHQIVWHFMAAL